MSQPVLNEATPDELSKLITPGKDIEKPALDVKATEVVVDPPPTDPGIPPANIIDAKDLLSGAETLPFETAVTDDEPSTEAQPGKRGRGRPPGAKNRRPSFQDLEQITATEVIVDHKAMSVMIFDSSTGCLAMTLGDEWRPRSDEERAGMLGAIEAYLVATKAKDIPPGVMLTLVILAYSAPRLQAPSTASKLQLAWSWVKVKVFPFFRRKSKVSTVVPIANQTNNTA